MSDRAKGSTAVTGPAAQVRDQLAALCAAARGEYFEDGVESPFSRELVCLIEEHGEAAVEPLAELIGHDLIGDEVASEALRWLGLMERGPAYGGRRRLLEDCLRSHSLKVRDGAALGLSFLNDPHAIPYLNRAIEREERQWLRQEMQHVVEELGGRT